jgi:cellulose synthase/poly-beta-1,6-N-acetylglucosamine synthase-like glycosyltransferase
VRLLADLALSGAGIILLVPILVLLAEALAALLPASEEAEAPLAAPPRVAVLIPAHDEAAQIEATVRALARQLPAGGRLVVIADNCSDDTAALAAGAGATVVERRNPDQIGKGFAISFGLRSLDLDPPDVVILVDADCRVSDGGLAAIATLAARTGRPVQAEYLLEAPPGGGAMAAVSALAILVRNRVRPRGLRRMGFPCHLTGSGMAFPWRVLREAPETGSNLVEDLVMGIELAILGTPARLCPAVQIGSELPPGAAAGLKQRRRWEHGQLHTLTHYVPRLLGAGFARRRMDLVALGLDLAVPPLALLVTAQGGLLAVTIVTALVGISSTGPACLAATGMAGLTAAVGLAWVGFGRRILPLRQFLFIPLYLLWKIPLYVGLALRGKQKRWERTERAADAKPASESDVRTP